MEPSHSPERTGPENISLSEAIGRAGERFGDSTAIVFQDREVSFATVDALADRVAAYLAGRGIAKGDRVGLYCINCDIFTIAYAGIVKAGATVVPVNVLLNPKEASYILQDAGARGLIYHEAFAAAVEAIAGGLPELRLRVRIGDAPSGDADTPWQEVVDAADPVPAIDIDPAEDVAAILYTSGTTGYPKGAMLTHRNLVANTWSLSQALPLVPGQDSILVVLPMFHSFAATAGMLFPLLYGVTSVLLPRFDPAEVAETVEHRRITLFLGVPSMYSTLLRLPIEATPKLALLRYCISGGAAMPQQVMESFEARFATPIYEGDGPTECSPVTCVNPLGGQRKPASVGLPVPLVEMRILDDDGAERPDGEVGELCVRGPNVMKGYWNRPEDTAASFFGDWFRTGDLATRDGDGYFFIVDRKKDMIIVNGMNVYPRMVEEVLYRHPAVAEAAVVGEPNQLHGEIPVAHVVLKAEAPALAAELRAFCRQSLGRHQVPRKVFFREALPKNATGKILKRELRTQGELERGVDSRAEDA